MLKFYALIRKVLSFVTKIRDNQGTYFLYVKDLRLFLLPDIIYSQFVTNKVSIALYKHNREGKKRERS
jgi:hypothetical protein